ncbi:MAG: outer membrane beta-barrel protein [Pseudomonadota bacterium]|nr:outer membrane beta-barrel protein [Pseudomonadota bacterium]
MTATGLLCALSLPAAAQEAPLPRDISRDLQRRLDPSLLNQGIPAESRGNGLRRQIDPEQAEQSDPLEHNDFPGLAGDPLAAGEGFRAGRPAPGARDARDETQTGDEQLLPGQQRPPFDPTRPDALSQDPRAPQQLSTEQQPLPNPDDPLSRNPDDPNRARIDGEPPVLGPYDPLGVRVGSFLLFPEISVEGVYNDNLLLATTGAQSDTGVAFLPGVAFRSQWSRHELTGQAKGNIINYNELTSEDERSLTAGLQGRMDITARTQLRGELNYESGQEERSSTDFPDGAAERPEFRNHGAAVQGDHRINRVRLRLRAETRSEDFDDSRLITGVETNNDDRDFTEKRLTGRVGYDLQPGVTAFVQASGNTRDFRQSLDDNGLRNGSSGHDVQAGMTFELTGKLSGEISAGYARQSPDENSLKDVEGFIFNAGLVWAATGLTTVRFNASSEVSETTSTSSAGSLVRAAEVAVEHALRRNIILGASLGYEIESFAGEDREEKEYTAGLTGEYLLSRWMALTAKYEHVTSTSTDPGQDYVENEVRLGLRVRR